MMQLLRPRLRARLSVSKLNRCVSQAPSETTTVMLKKLHPSATAATLQEVVDASGLRIRKTFIEPGCGVQLANEVQAECVSTLLQHEFGCSTTIAGTMSPAVLLKNVSSTLSAQDIKKAFVQHDPKGVHLSGGTSFVCYVTDNLEALAVAKVVQEISLNGQTLSASPNKLGDKKYSVYIYNIPHSVSLGEAQRAIEKALSVHSTTIQVIPNAKQGHVLTVKIPVEAKIDSAAVATKLATLSTASNPFIVSAPEAVNLPTVFLRNVSKIGKTEVENAISQFPFERIQFTYKTKDLLGDLAVVYFKTQADALSCLSAIKNVRLNGKRLSSSFRETAEPGIVITGLDISFEGDADEVMRMFKDLDPVHYVVKSRTEMVIVFRNEKDASTASVLAHKLEFKGTPVNAEVTGLQDIGFKITMDSSATTAPTVETIRSALESIGVPLKDLTVDSNLSAFVTFETLHRATMAQHGVEEGTVSLATEASAGPASRLTSAVSVYPACAVAVESFPEDVPVSKVSEYLKQHGIKPICIDRSAILKFKRNMDVVPGMKVLKTLQLGGLQLMPERYRRLETLVKDREYDTHGNDETFNMDFLRETMKECMHYNPATRLHIARNTFERAVFTAKQHGDNAFLYDPTAPAEFQDEINEIMAAKEPDVDRLFELFIQREDMRQFSFDFRSLTALFGKAEGPEKDPFNWSSFKIDSDEEFLRLREAMRLSAELDDELTLKDFKKGKKQLSAGEILKIVDERRAAAGKKTADDDDTEIYDDNDDEHGFAPIKGASSLATPSSGSEENEEDDIEISHSGEGDTTEKRDFQDKSNDENSPEDFMEVRDRNGYVWSGLIINTDTTNTTLPSGRLMTHRCLVMVGNMQGAGGFGMGKGENSQLAMKRAFR